MKSKNKILKTEKHTKVLITGGTAKNGGAVIDDLIKTGHPVRAMVHSIDERSEELEAKGVKVVTAIYFSL